MSESQARGSASCMHLFLLCRDKRFAYSPASSPDGEVVVEEEVIVVMKEVMVDEEEDELSSKRKRLKASYPPGIM